MIQPPGEKGYDDVLVRPAAVEAEERGVAADLTSQRERELEVLERVIVNWVSLKPDISTVGDTAQIDKHV